jgi:hypothetical protein
MYENMISTHTPQTSFIREILFFLKIIFVVFLLLLFFLISLNNNRITTVDGEEDDDRAWANLFLACEIIKSGSPLFLDSFPPGTLDRFSFWPDGHTNIIESTIIDDRTYSVYWRSTSTSSRFRD